MTEESPPRDPIVELYKGLIATQMLAIPVKEIVSCLLVEVANLHPHPDKLLANMFEHISKRLDPVSGRYSEKESIAESRHVLEAMFRDATLGIQKKAGDRT